MRLPVNHRHQEMFGRCLSILAGGYAVCTFKDKDPAASTIYSTHTVFAFRGCVHFEVVCTSPLMDVTRASVPPDAQPQRSAQGGQAALRPAGARGCGSGGFGGSGFVPEGCEGTERRKCSPPFHFWRRSWNAGASEKGMLPVGNGRVFGLSNSRPKASPIDFASGRHQNRSGSGSVSSGPNTKIQSTVFGM